jgi:hypothetical protein
LTPRFENKQLELMGQEGLVIINKMKLKVYWFLLNYIDKTGYLVRHICAMLILLILH